MAIMKNTKVQTIAAILNGLVACIVKNYIYSVTITKSAAERWGLTGADADCGGEAQLFLKVWF